MGTRTDIDWCDSTVNPTTGCVGCELKRPGKPGTCYAATLHEGRLAKSLPDLYDADFHKIRLAPGRMAKAASWSDLRGKDRPDKPWLNGMPRMIFVGDMGDIFSPAVPFEYLRDEVLAAAQSKAGRRHVWLWLTKQPKRAAEFAKKHWPLPDNVWLGVSVTSEDTAWRAYELLKIDAAKRFVSFEPMLGPVGFGGSLLGISWLILGGESGPNARPCNVEWIRSGVKQCREAGVKAFVKQLGARPSWRPKDGPCPIFPEHVKIQYQRGYENSEHGIVLRDPKGGEMDEWPEDLRVREVPR